MLHPSLLVAVAVAVATMALAACVRPPPRAAPPASQAPPTPSARAAPAGQCQPPPLQLGLDAFRRFDKLSYLELGPRVAGETTADPAGTNNDNSHPVRIGPGGERVLLDQVGPGLVTFLRMQESIGAPWHLAVDAQPAIAVRPEDLGQPGGPFPFPLSLNVDQTPGSSILATPLPFARSIRWSSSGPNGNFYALLRRLPLGTPPVSWSAEPADAVARLLRQPPRPPPLTTERGTLTLAPGRETTVATVVDGPRQIRMLRFRVPVARQAAFGNARLRIYWDGEAAASVDVPVKFAAGAGGGVYQPPDRPLVGAWPVQVSAADGGTTGFAIAWPMPFADGARVTLTAGEPIERLAWSAGHEAFPDPRAWWGTFHAAFTDVPRPPPGEDLTFLDIRGSGRLVGTVVNFSEVGPTLEGDPRVYLDDARTPQVRVTGTEEWGLGGNYWRFGQQRSLPFGGLPSATNNPPGTDVDGAALYRFLVADSVAFNRRLLVRWEHGAANDSPLRYRAASFWYATPTVTALPTDALDVGDPQSRAAHTDRSQGTVYDLTAAYGYAPRSSVSTGMVRATTADSSFGMAVDPRNVGAFLRRTFDDGVPDQRADVLVDGRFAGTWYTPGSFAGADAQGTPRRWRDDEFPLPPALTAGKRSVRVTLRHVPTLDPPNQAWTASRYELYSLVTPGC